jgi:hypothetical protein
VGQSGKKQDLKVRKKRDFEGRTKQEKAGFEGGIKLDLKVG